MRKIVIQVPNPMVGDVLDYLESLTGIQIDMPISDRQAEPMRHTSRAWLPSGKAFVRDAIIVSLQSCPDGLTREDIAASVKFHLAGTSRASAASSFYVALTRLVAQGLVRRIDDGSETVFRLIKVEADPTPVRAPGKTVAGIVLEFLRSNGPSRGSAIRSELRRQGFSYGSFNTKAIDRMIATHKIKRAGIGVYEALVNGAAI